jgi:hypothetical protein
MREDDGRKLDHKTLEQLRIRAVRQIEQGAHPEQVAQALGMTPGGGVCLAGEIPRGWAGGAQGPSGPWAAAETFGPPAWPAVRAGRGQRPSTVAVRVCAADPRDGPRADRPRVRPAAVGGQRRVGAAQAGAVAAAAAVSRPPAELPGDGALEGRDLPQIRAQAAEAGATIYFADEAGGALRLARGDHLSADWPHSGGDDHRRPVRGQPDLGRYRQGQAGVCGLRRQPERASVPLLLPPAAARRPGWGCFWSWMAIRCTAPTRQGVRCGDRRSAAAVLPAGLLAGAEP